MKQNHGLNRWVRFCLTLTLLGITAAGFVPPAGASFISYSAGGGAGNTDLNAGVNWTGGVPPGAVDDGSWNLNAANFYDVTASSNRTFATMFLDTDKVNFNFDTNTVTVAALRAGENGTRNANIRLSGGTLTVSGNSGFSVGSAGGTPGIGLLTIHGSNSFLRVTGAGTHFIGTGTGTGFLTVTNGGHANLSAGSVLLGGDPNLSGIKVTGSGSELVIRSLITTAADLSSITVENQGSLIISNGYTYGNNLERALIRVRNNGSLSVALANQTTGLGQTSAGGGEAVLSISNGGTYQVTTVNINNDGKLHLEGGTLLASVVNVGNATPTHAGAMLLGSGTIKNNDPNNNVNIRGMFKPGDELNVSDPFSDATVADVGSLTIGQVGVALNLIMNSTFANTTFDFANATSHDRVFVNGNFTAGGVLNLNFGFTPDPSETYTLFTVSGTSNTGNPNPFSAINWSGGVVGGTATWDGNNFIVTDFVPIPEPSTVMLFSVGLGLLGWRHRGKRPHSP